MPTIQNNKICKIGTGYAIFLPVGWIRYNQLKQGDVVEIIANGIIRVKPKQKEGGK